MTYRWRITVQVWPHSTGKGSDIDQAAVGDRERYYYVNADDIDGALRLARAFADGLRGNPAVWKVPIFAVNRWCADKPEGISS